MNDACVFDNAIRLREASKATLIHVKDTTYPCSDNLLVKTRIARGREAPRQTQSEP